MQMAHSAIFGWDVSKVQVVLANGVKSWLKARRDGGGDRYNGGDEAVLLEMLSIVQDVVDEVLGLERPFSDDEGSVVGEVLAEAVEFVAIAQCVCLSYRQFVKRLLLIRLLLLGRIGRSIRCRSVFQVRLTFWTRITRALSSGYSPP